MLLWTIEKRCKKCNNCRRLDALVPQDHLLWKLEIRPVFATITADPAQNPVEVGLDTGGSGERVLNSSDAGDRLADVLGDYRRGLDLADIVLEEVAGLVLLEVNGCRDKGLANALRELFVADAHDVPHIENLYAQKANESNGHQYSEYPDCLLLHKGTSVPCGEGILKLTFIC